MDHAGKGDWTIPPNPAMIVMSWKSAFVGSLVGRSVSHIMAEKRNHILDFNQHFIEFIWV